VTARPTRWRSTPCDRGWPEDKELNGLDLIYAGDPARAPGGGEPAEGGDDGGKKFEPPRRYRPAFSTPFKLKGAGRRPVG